MNCCFEIFEVFSSNRTDKAFEIFLSDGDSGYYNTIRRGLQAGDHQGPAIILPKALRILVRLCSQVPAKVQSALLLVACVTTLGERGGEPKNKQRIKRPKQNWAVRRPMVTKRSTANANPKKASRQQCRSRISTFFFPGFGRWRSKARSCNSYKLRTNEANSTQWFQLYSQKSWQWPDKRNRKRPETKNTQRPANPPARFAFRLAKNGETTEGPNKNNHTKIATRHKGNPPSMP